MKKKLKIIILLLVLIAVSVGLGVMIGENIVMERIQYENHVYVNEVD